MTFVNVIQFNSIGGRWHCDGETCRGKVTIVISRTVCVFSWYFKWGKREMLMSVLLQREV